MAKTIFSSGSSSGYNSPKSPREIDMIDIEQLPLNKKPSADEQIIKNKLGEAIKRRMAHD